MRVAGISGSLRRDSHNTKLLGVAARLLPPDVELVLADGLEHIPPFNEDDERTPPPSVRLLREQLARVDAVLIATPEYNSSIPGQLKNVLDWLSRPAGASALQGKPVLVIGASSGIFGAVWAQAEARKVLAAMGAKPLDAEFPVASAGAAFEDGRLADPELSALLEALLVKLVAQPAARREAPAVA